MRRYREIYLLSTRETSGWFGPNAASLILSESSKNFSALSEVHDFCEFYKNNEKFHRKFYILQFLLVLPNRDIQAHRLYRLYMDDLCHI